MINKQRKLLKVFLLLLLLSGCSGLSVSPEDAALRKFMQETGDRMLVDQDSLEVRQTLDVDDQQSIVMLSFQGTRHELGPVTCLYSYQTLKGMLGWMAANGGGGCRQDQPDEPPQALEVMGGHYSGQKPQDPGYSQLYGYVHNPDIVKVLVTWDDNQVTEIDVVNDTILTVRMGDSMMKEVEGRDAQDETVYTYLFQNPPDPRP